MSQTFFVSNRVRSAKPIFGIIVGTEGEVIEVAKEADCVVYNVRFVGNRERAVLPDEIVLATGGQHLTMRPSLTVKFKPTDKAE
jgi:hypothetical protein